jgi:ComF family protein
MSVSPWHHRSGERKQLVSAADQTAHVQRLIDLLLPPQCPGCGTDDLALCARCRESIARRLAEPPGLPFGLSSAQPAGLAQLEWCCAFTGPARACLHALKYDGERRLVGPLAGLMAERWKKVGIGGEVLVPVPVHAQRLRERGFDQAELLANEVGRHLRMPVTRALERGARTQAQHGLGRGARAGNVGKAFHVSPRLAPSVRDRWVVLIDDVVTTGATLNACAAALRASGTIAVSALTLARER